MPAWAVRRVARSGLRDVVGMVPASVEVDAVGDSRPSRTDEHTPIGVLDPGSGRPVLQDATRGRDFHIGWVSERPKGEWSNGPEGLAGCNAARERAWRRRPRRGRGVEIEGRHKRVAPARGTGWLLLARTDGSEGNNERDYTGSMERWSRQSHWTAGRGGSR